MSFVVSTILLNSLAADPGSPTNGEIWHNSTSNEIKARLNGVTRVLATEAQLANYLLRDGTNAMTANLDAGSNKIVNVTDPSNPQDAATLSWTNDQITAKLAGLDFQESVIDKDLATPPGSPTTGDRYIVNATATGAWTGWEDSIVEWDVDGGGVWERDIPNEGFTTRVMDENKFYTFDGTSWGLWDAVVDHGNLLGLADDDHTQYLLASGARALAGNLDMGGNAITNVTTVDGVTVDTHAARHQPGGADALTTATAVDTGSANAAGGGTALALAAHTHRVVDFFLASQANGDMAYFNGTNWVRVAAGTSGQHLRSNGAAAPTWEAAGGGATIKSERRLAANFSGTPMTSTIVFSTAFGDNNYGVSVVLECANNVSYAFHIHTKTAAGFIIELASNDKADLVAAQWIATPHSDP